MPDRKQLCRAGFSTAFYMQRQTAPAGSLPVITMACCYQAGDFIPNSCAKPQRTMLIAGLIAGVIAAPEGSQYYDAMRRGPGHIDA